MHGLFGAVRMYLVSADRIGRGPASLDDGSAPPRNDGASAPWAAWARAGEGIGREDRRPPVSRVAGAVHIAGAGRLRPG